MVKYIEWYDMICEMIYSLPFYKFTYERYGAGSDMKLLHERLQHDSEGVSHTLGENSVWPDTSYCSWLSY